MAEVRQHPITDDERAEVRALFEEIRAGRMQRSEVLFSAPTDPGEAGADVQWWLNVLQQPGNTELVVSDETITMSREQVIISLIHDRDARPDSGTVRGGVEDDIHGRSVRAIVSEADGTSSEYYVLLPPKDEF